MIILSRKGFPLRNIGILTQDGNFLPMLSPLMENKNYVQGNFTLSKVSEPSGDNGECGMLLMANYGSKLYIFDTTFVSKKKCQE